MMCLRAGQPAGGGFSRNYRKRKACPEQMLRPIITGQSVNQAAYLPSGVLRKSQAEDEHKEKR